MQENDGLRAALQQVNSLQDVRQKLTSTAPASKADDVVKADTPPMRANGTAARPQPQAAERLSAQMPVNDPHGTHLAVQTQLGSVSTYRFDPAKHAAFGAAGVSPAFTPPGEADSPASLAGAQSSASGGSALPQSSVQYFPWAHVREGPGFNTTPWQPPAWMAQQQQQMAQMVAQQALAAQQLVAQQQLQQAQLAQQQLVTQHYISQQAAATGTVPAKKNGNPVLNDTEAKPGSGHVKAEPSGAVNAVLAAETEKEAGCATAAGPPAVAPLSPDKHSLLPFETDLDTLRLGGLDFGEPDELGWSDEVFSLGEPIFN